MTVEDARRKIALLRRVSTDKGALAAEREAAYRLQKALMERYAIKDQEIPDGQTTSRPFSLNWDYWKELLGEFDLSLTHFGGRGSVEIGRNIIAHIRLAANEWWIEERTPRGRQITVRDRGFDTMRTYLKEHAPRGYSFLRR
ncbi:MAG: hypothetical protein WAU82_00450 [Candidatus Binatus sp.]|uniref:hypothetical protein n=1 Tax=Candidatus Binatus sp. TaxID=2811406 RepID=UPI003BAE74D6